MIMSLVVLCFLCVFLLRLRSSRIIDNTRAQQKALDDELVAPTNRLKIGKSNLRLSSILKSKEPTLQVELDALKLTPFYNAFEISADVPEIYMQEFWVTVSRHHSLLRFKLNGKSHTVNVDNFRDMLKIFPKLPGQKFDEPPIEEEILSFIRDIGHTGEIKFLSDVNVNHMHQPWRSFAAIINKCISGKTTALESLHLVFQVENKNSKKNNDIYYPRFTKVIIDYFIAKDQAIPRRNKMFWHYSKDDFMFTTVRVISKHQDTQVYGIILPQHLTNMLKFKAYMTYRAYATGEKIPKPKSTKKKADLESSPKTKPTQASKGKRIKTSTKRDKAAKMKQSVTKSKGLTVLSEVALSEDDQIKLATKRNKKEFNSSHASGSGDGVDIQSKVPDEQQHIVFGTNEGAGAGDKPEVPNVPEYKSESEEKSWTFSQGEAEEENDEHDNVNDNDDEDDDQDNDIRETESDNDRDNFVSTPPDYEMSDEEENQEDDDNVMGGEQEDKEDEELYRDLNLKVDKIDAEIIDAQTNQETEEVHVTLTTEPLVVQQQSSSVSSDLLSKFINPSPDIEIPNITSLFGFEQRVSSLETKLSELKQTNQFAKALSSISGIVDNYLMSKMKDAVNVAVQLQSNKLRTEAQSENDEFLKHIDSNIKAIIKDQVKAQTSYAAATSLLEFELKKILIDKIEENKSMNRSDIQKNLYNTLIESYNSDKDLFASYGDVVTLKRGRDDQDKDEEPLLDQTKGRSERDRQRRRHQKKRLKNVFQSKSTSFQRFNMEKMLVSLNAIGRQVIPFDHFINNDLEYLKGGSLSQKYITSLTKTKAADYGHVKWIEDKVPRSIWSPAQVVYDKHAYWRTYH
ncbi:hypothetical protein Tco_0900612 [Tanacetum coccineum]